MKIEQQCDCWVDDGVMSVCALHYNRLLEDSEIKKFVEKRNEDSMNKLSKIVRIGGVDCVITEVQKKWVK